MTDEGISHETLMRYLDGELPPEERRRVDRALEASTELMRDFALYQRLHDDFAAISFDRREMRNSVWARVSRRVARPMGWLLLATGLLAWLAHITYLYFASPAASWEKVATSAIVIGVLLLFASVIHERYREFLTDPYRDVER